MRSCKPHLEVLRGTQKEIWPTLGWTSANHFVLYGGTAIALRCGHRASIDFDFFTDRPLNQSTILQELRKPRIAFHVVQDEKNSLAVVTEPGDVRLSFFGGLDMGRVGVPEMTEDGIVVVASSLDLLGTKLKVIMQRAESKNYSDIAKLLQGGPSLIQGLGAAWSLYGSAFAPAECLRALTFFDDGDLSRVIAETRNILRVEAAKASKVFPIPSIEKISNQLSDEGIVRGRKPRSRRIGTLRLNTSSRPRRTPGPLLVSPRAQGTGTDAVVSLRHYLLHYSFRSPYKSLGVFTGPVDRSPCGLDTCCK